MNERAGLPIARVLIYGLQFSENNVGGIYLANLFSAYPREEMATISSKTISPDNAYCKYCYRLGTREYKNVLDVASKNRYKAKCDKEKSVRKATSESKVEAKCKKSGIKEYIKSSTIMQYIKQETTRVKKTRELEEYIDTVNPGVIYGVCSDYNSTKLLVKISEFVKVPLVLHMMDDWPETLYTDGLEKLTIRPKYRTMYRKLIAKSDVVIGICADMAKEYRIRYEREVISYPIPVSLLEYRNLFRSDWVSGNPFTIRYGGRVGWAIRQCLEDVALAVDQLYKEGIGVSFEIATNQEDRVPQICHEMECVRVSKLAPLDELPRIASECDLHLICYDFDELSKRQARFSMPGKLPACMASGTPILVYSPPELPVVKYAQEYQWGSLVTVRDKKTLADRIRNLIQNESLRKSLGTTARQIAFNRHDAEVISADFRRMIENLVDEHRRSNPKD